MVQSPTRKTNTKKKKKKKTSRECRLFLPGHNSIVSAPFLLLSQNVLPFSPSHEKEEEEEEEGNRRESLVSSRESLLCPISHLVSLCSSSPFYYYSLRTQKKMRVKVSFSGEREKKRWKMVASFGRKKTRRRCRVQMRLMEYSPLLKLTDVISDG